MPLPKTSPDMSPTPTTVNSSCLRVDAQLAEVPLDALPRALGGDPHRLVVVAHGAAGRERVTEPEPVGHRDLVGDVGELRRALVGRDDEVGVVGVVAHDVGRRHGLHRAVFAGDEVVGDVEQARDERAVAGLDLGGARPGRAHHEAALRADRHDHRVLHRLRLDQAEDLGAVVGGPVRPSQTTPGDRAEPQVHALDPRRVHEDLEARPRRGHTRHLRRVDLEREERALAEPVGAQRRHDHREEAAQDAVGVQPGDGVDAGAHVGDGVLDRLVAMLAAPGRTGPGRAPAARARRRGARAACPPCSARPYGAPIWRA